MSFRLAWPLALLFALLSGCHRQPEAASRLEFKILLPSAEGLRVGSSVHLRGVPVGEVRDIRLGPDPDRLEVELLIEVDQQASRWLRTGTFARIRSLGLTNGERFVDLLPGPRSGSPLAPGAIIPAAVGLDVDQLMASGEDLVSNLVMISSQLAAILGRLERGEGFLGALTRDAAQGVPLAERLDRTLETIESTARRLESGEGTLPRLLRDPALAASLESSLERLQRVLAQAEAGPGTVAALLADSELRGHLTRSAAQLDAVTCRLDNLLARLEAGESFLGKLLMDPESGEKMASELERLLSHLAIVAEKLATGQGTAGKLIDDPAVYEAVQDVVVGVRESALLRWLVRNRQKRGIRERYERERQETNTSPRVPSAESSISPPPPLSEPPAATQTRSLPRSEVNHASPKP